MSIGRMVKASYASSNDLYVCTSCLVVRLIPKEIQLSTEVQTTAKLTDTSPFLEVTIPCPVCKIITRHVRTLEASSNGLAQSAVAGLTQGAVQALLGKK